MLSAFTRERYPAVPFNFVSAMRNLSEKSLRLSFSVIILKLFVIILYLLKSKVKSYISIICIEIYAYMIYNASEVVFVDNFVNISTPCGEIKGLKLEDHIQFRGIKYAGASRWEYPTEVMSWNGVYDATEFGACSYQRRGFEDDAKCNAFYHKEFRKGLSFSYSEDCLFLNIWAPEHKKDCPVIIYIHGGSFTGGSGNEGHISGEKLAKDGIVFVSINYRLGPYGFCSHPDLKNKDGICGNFGLFDQLTAIKWVKHNIAAFGGNPDNITLMGQSAGAMSIDILISDEECRNMISGAVMMSGASLQRAVARPESPEKTRKFWDKIMENAKVNSIEELRNTDEKTLFYAWSDTCKSDKLSMLHTMPVKDGKLITDSNFNMKNIPDIPMILGATITDMIPIVLEELTKKYAKKCDSHKNPCYVYNFDRLLPGDDSGAWHSCDLLYAFSTLKNNWRPFEDIDFEISQKMHDMLCAFAQTQNPNCKSIPTWEKGGKMPLHFCENTYTGKWRTKDLFSNTFGNKGAEF